MNLFPLLDFVKQQVPKAQITRASLFSSGVVSIGYRIDEHRATAAHALHVWPDGRYAFRPSAQQAVQHGHEIAEIGHYLTSNVPELWLLQHVRQLHGLVLADNVRAAIRELEAVCRPWQKPEPRHIRWPLAYALAVVQRASGVRYGAKCLHLLDDGSLVANLAGKTQVLLSSSGVVMARTSGNRRAVWRASVLDSIGQQLNHLWQQATQHTRKHWINTLHP